MTDDFIVTELEKRRGKLEGLVVSGGEPTLQEDLPQFLLRVKELGYKIKLDTNGSRPELLQHLAGEGLLNYIAMDVKAPVDAYERLCGAPVSTDALRASIAFIAGSGIAHHFRTTYVKPLMTPEDLNGIKALIPAGSTHIIQPFNPEFALDPELRRVSLSR